MFFWGQKSNVSLPIGDEIIDNNNGEIELTFRIVINEKVLREH